MSEPGAAGWTRRGAARVVAGLLLVPLAGIESLRARESSLTREGGLFDDVLGR